MFTKNDVFELVLMKYAESNYKNMVDAGISEDGAAKAANTKAENLRKQYREASV